MENYVVYLILLEKMKLLLIENYKFRDHLDENSCHLRITKSRVWGIQKLSATFLQCLPGSSSL
jgi:hypothetical protein